MAIAAPVTLLSRDSSESTAQKFLDAIANPFASQLAGEATLSSLLFSIVLGTSFALLFCFIRPYNNVVYAPRAKYADSKHAPPPVKRGLFAWIPPLVRTKEADLVEKVGLDAAVFMRVCRMLRNILTILAVFGCGIILPVNIIAWHDSTKNSTNPKRDSLLDDTAKQIFNAMTPLFIIGGPSFWAYVVVAYIFDIVIMVFLFFNYRAIVRLRREYYDSPDYQRSLHARTLMITDIPKEYRSDDGIVRIAEEIRAPSGVPRAAIARNVKDLPELVEEYEETVKSLEEYLAKYLKNPDKLPANRPTCKPSKKDRSYTSGQKVDAIEYLTSRIKELEHEIKEVRDSVDKRNALPYGFASYEGIAEAHGVAYVARKGGPHSTVVQMAPKPTDLVWKNLKLNKKERRWRNFINNVWVALLTIVWIAPNVLIAVFLSNLAHLGGLWPAFNANLMAHPKSWALVQGIAAPLLTTLFYLILPSIFRKLAVSSGDVSKTSREIHVMRSLYAFFTLNNLIVFSLFSAVFAFISALSSGKNISQTHPFTSLVQALCTVSQYWVSWLLQRQLGAALDLSQLWTLFWGSLVRRFGSPTPRRQIELTAPQPFDYAGYYNYFLFYTTIALCFATIQPLVLPITAFYFWLDSFAKKYLILYVFITKYESGGMFWRPIFNRVLFMTILGNCIIALLIGGQSPYAVTYIPQLAALAPLPFIVLAFKWYCWRTFDEQIEYYQKGKSVRDSEHAAGLEQKKARKHDRVGVKFGNPVLYKPLITPMVSAKSRHLLKSIYAGRTELDTDAGAGYSDVYMENMDSRQPGRTTTTTSAAPFEFVSEAEMDFEHYKDRPEFRDEAGGNGQLFGHASDITRPSTPGGSSVMTGLTRVGTQDSFSSQDPKAQHPAFRQGHTHTRSSSRGSDSSKFNETTAVGGTEYPRGYHATPSALREQSPAGSDWGVRGAGAGQRNDSRERLYDGAAPMGRVPVPRPGTAGSGSGRRPVNNGGYGEIRYGGFGAETPESSGVVGDETSYDYFRRGRTQGL